MESKELSDNIFTDIDINFPRLESIYIYGTKVNVTEKTILMMSRLTRLLSISLYLSKNQNKTEISSQLDKKCKKLRKIHIN